MFKRLLGGGLAAAIGLLGLSVPAALAQPAQPARAARPAAVLPGLHVMNLHAAYERALPTAKSGKPSGIVYAIGHAPKAARTAGAAGASGCSEPNCNLVYHGGPVQHDPKIYLLLWGPNWTTDSSQAASASYLESFLQGLGAQPQDNWSTITAQYTDSTGFPGIHGSEYMGVYQDIKTPPTGTTETQFAAEADAFATAHGLTGDVNAQIVIATQSGTCPSGFAGGGPCPGGGQYCAWHTNSVNTGVTFTNLPYLLDAGSSCGENFVNSTGQGLYDGFSIVEGHEYAETITDPYPNTGWIDLADGVSGGEIGDKCAWGGQIWGSSDPYGNVTLSTGTFAMQSLWNNAAGACTMSPTTDTLTVTSPGSQTLTAGQSVSLQIKATSSTGAKLEYYATGLPAGLSVNPATGLITGSPTTPGTGSATITTDDTTGAIGTTTFNWTVNPAPDTVTVTSPGNQTTTAGQSVSLPIKATSSTGATLTYQAAGLPAGLNINSTSGLITGTPNSPGGPVNVTITVTDTTGGKGTATFTWTINPVPPPPTTFRIKGYKSQCVTDYQYLSAPGTKAVINPCNTLLREKWTTGAGNSLKINGLCLTDPAWGRWGTKLVLEPCTGFKNQNWTLHPNGEYTTAVHGLCLTDPRWSTTSGTQLIIQSCRDWANQRWTKD